MNPRGIPLFRLAAAKTPMRHPAPLTVALLASVLAVSGLTGCQSGSSVLRDHESRQAADLQIDRQIQELRQRAEKVEAAAARAGVDITPPAPTDGQVGG